MRVAIVSPYDLSVPGGVQSHVRSLAERLRDAGDTVATLSPGPDEPPHHHGVGRTMALPFNDSVAPVAWSPLAARRVLERLRDLRPDVVHVHEPAVPFTSLAATLRPVAPTVGTFHAWSDSDLVYRAARPLVRRAADQLSVRIAVSDAARSYHANALRLPHGAFRVIPNGVEVARFAEAEPLPDVTGDGRTHLLFVGRLETRKGLEQLIRAFILLRANRSDLRLLVVGDGPERDRCQGLVPAQLRPDVVFLGRVDGTELARFYRSCDLFVAPALGGESQGIVLLESMAASCAVVASDIPGYATVVRDHETGRLVPPGQPKALADAIAVLLDNPALRSALAERAREVVADYDWHVVAARIRGAYLEAAGS